MNRLCPAETRLKEGAHAHDSDQNRWECSLAAGWWRPVSALPPVSRDRRFDVKRAEVGAVSLEARQPSVSVMSYHLHEFQLLDAKDKIKAIGIPTDEEPGQRRCIPT